MPVTSLLLYSTFYRGFSSRLELLLNVFKNSLQNICTRVSLSVKLHAAGLSVRNICFFVDFRKVLKETVFMEHFCTDAMCFVVDS